MVPNDPNAPLPVDAPVNAALPAHVTAGYAAPDPAAGDSELRVPGQLPPVADVPTASAPVSSPAPSVVQPATLAHVDKAAVEIKATVVAAHESILQKIEAGFEKLGTIVKDVAVDLPRVVSDTPQVRAAISGIVADALVIFKDVEAEYSDATSLNFPAAITLAPTTIAAFAKLVADVKSGNAVVIADLVALGVPI